MSWLKLYLSHTHRNWKYFSYSSSRTTVCSFPLDKTSFRVYFLTNFGKYKSIGKCNIFEQQSWDQLKFHNVSLFVRLITIQRSVMPKLSNLKIILGYDRNIRHVRRKWGLCKESTFAFYSRGSIIIFLGWLSLNGKCLSLWFNHIGHWHLHYFNRNHRCYDLDYISFRKAEINFSAVGNFPSVLKSLNNIFTVSHSITSLQTSMLQM